LTAKRGDALLAAAENLNEAISRRTQEEVFAIARQALNDLATTSLEEQLGEVFIRRLRELAPQAKADLAKALQATSEPVLVRSAFDLPAKSRQAIQEALNATFARDIAVRFATAPQVVSGIELSVSGQKVAWSLAEYLTALEKSVRELLLEGTHTAAAASAVTAPPRAAEPVLAAADR
jgi:F-type H+-transporting ATPase subunit b